MGIRINVSGWCTLEGFGLSSGVWNLWPARPFGCTQTPMAAACRPIDFRMRCVWFSSCRTQSKQSVQPGIRPLFYVWRVYARLSLRVGIQASVYWRGALRILCSVWGLGTSLYCAVYCLALWRDSVRRRIDACDSEIWTVWRFVIWRIHLCLSCAANNGLADRE